MEWLNAEIESLKKKGLFREMVCVDGMQGPVVSAEGRELLLFSSNNYLGLASHPEVIQAQTDAVKKYGTGACASRLISGNMHLHEKLEKRIAEFKNTESAIVFPTGYMANLGVISALMSGDDLVLCDKLNHASIIDGIKLSGAKLRVYPHKNLDRLDSILKKSKSLKKKLIVSDGVFSMDGDIAPVRELIRIAKKYGAMLMIDDAHATGVLGSHGRGSCEYHGYKEGVDINMGTLSKALGNLGGFIAGKRSLIEYIRNKARSFIYTTALPPAILGGSVKAVDIAERGMALRKKLWSNVKNLKEGLISLGFNIMGSQTQIIPVWLGNAEKTMMTSKFLLREGILAPGIRPPTVAKTGCRIRLSVMATHKDEHIRRLIDVFGRI